MTNEVNRPVWNDVSYAYRVGRLVPGPCEVCGSTGKVDAHHDDYEKPLDVRWFCRTHHSAIHGQRGRKRSEACPRGHPWTPENMYTYERMKPNGSGMRSVRICRTCRRIRERGL